MRRQNMGAEWEAQIAGARAAIDAGKIADITWPDGSKSSHSDHTSLENACRQSYARSNPGYNPTPGGSMARFVPLFQAVAIGSVVLALYFALTGTSLRQVLGITPRPVSAQSAPDPVPTTVPPTVVASPVPTDPARQPPPVRPPVTVRLVVAKEIHLRTSCGVTDRRGRPVAVLATLKPGWEVTPTGPVNGTGWRPVEWAGQRGCVAARYLTVING